MAFSLNGWLKNKKSNPRGLGRNKPRSAGRSKSSRRLCLEPLEGRALLAAVFAEFVDPNPAAGNQFGAVVQPLSTGNVVITSPGDDAGGTNAGAVYLFNGSTGDLISTLRGSTAGDLSGSTVTELSNGNYVVLSSSWDSPDPVSGQTNAGAVTWGSGTEGVSGVISAENSLVGTKRFDLSGSGVSITALSNGDYVVLSTSWDNLVSGVANVGAVIWGSGTEGVSGEISATNSLVGSKASDLSSASITALSNGNYVVRSPLWDNGSVLNVGAVTWGSGTTGVAGTISDANSLIGSKSLDFLGAGTSVKPLSNGNYLVVNPGWDNGAVTDVGAVTWGSGTTGVTGPVSASNSLIGSTTSDRVGGNPFNLSGVTTLSNGNYVVHNAGWDNGAGAATWGNGTTGVSGTISAANSLIGSTAGDQVGLAVTELSNGNYVVQSPSWFNGSGVQVGAATWASGTTGVIGTISDANSLVGSTLGDGVGGSVVGLSNGNYVVSSRNWDNGPLAANVGAVTFGNGTIGATGFVSDANSLIGSTTSDLANVAVTPLSNGNYVVSSPNWDNPDSGVTNVGAVTWGSGTVGVAGTISASNSLIGSTVDDRVGGLSSGSFVDNKVTALPNGNYVVSSPRWDSGVMDVGAVTFGDGTTGTTGVVSVANSLIGSTLHDQVGLNITALSNGNYVVGSPRWDGAASDVGAVTWGSGTEGVSGVVSALNSLVGSTALDLVGSDGGFNSYIGVTVLSNGNYVVTSPFWDNGSVADAGAITWGNGTTGVAGVISAANSLVGSTASDTIGGQGVNVGVTALPNGNYVVSSPRWDNGPVVNAGAVTFGNGTTGVIGSITSVNSAIGTTANASLQAVVVDNANDTFFARFLAEDGGKVRVGSQDSGFPTITAPSDQTAYEDVEQAIDGISIVDAGEAELTFTLDVSYGTLSLGTIPVTLAVAGNGTGSLTLIGTSADINAALDSLVYRGDLNYSGGDTLALELTDAFLSGYETSVALNVVSAAEQATSLQALVSSLQTAGDLNEGQANSLVVKLNLEGDAGDIDQVQDFLNEVAAYRRARILTQDQADELSYWGNILLLGVTQR